jgi:hypothetical protein
VNGPEHYAEAERLLELSENTYWEGPKAQPEFARIAIAAAQAHATLALVAATADTRFTTPPQEWGGTETSTTSDPLWAEVIR